MTLIGGVDTRNVRKSYSTSLYAVVPVHAADCLKQDTLLINCENYPLCTFFVFIG